MRDWNEFVSAARAFRAALVADYGEAGAFARQVRNALARVYLAAALLGPPTMPENDEVANTPRREGDSAAVREQLKARFGEHDSFVEVYDPSKLVDEDVEPIERSVSFELVEIDEDLAEALALIEAGSADAAWEVPWAFENHLGAARGRVPPPSTPDRHLRPSLTSRDSTRLGQRSRMSLDVQQAGG